MRTRELLSLVVIICLSAQFSSYGQYNRTESKAMAVDAAGNPITIGHSMTYIDEFGKPLQGQVKHLTSNTVFASQPVYDRLGRARLQTLAAPIGASTFGYKANFITNSSGSPYSSTDFDVTATLNNPTPVGNTLTGTLGWYYSTRNTLEPATATTSYPYSRSWSEDGPDSRISKSAGPGNYYKMGSGHEVISERQEITATELNHYYSLRGHFTSTTTSLNTANGYKLVSTDPDGYQSVSYVDADGKTLASAVLEGGIYKYWSYAYYNDLGQLVATVSPKGVNTGSSAYPNFATTYEYDHRGLLIATEAPDEGRTEYMYATDGKLRFSQSAEQKARGNNIFSYTHYDYLGRLIEAGEYNGSLLFNSTGLKALLDTDGSIWPAGDVSDWGKVYYDLPQSDFPSDPNHPAQVFTYGAVVASENENTKTWYSYDEFGRLAFSIQHINELAKNYILDYTYDFVGNVTQVSYQRDIPGEGFFHHYIYDADQRLTEVYTSVDGVFANAYLHARYIYYLHGPLKRIELAEDLQGIDYTYTAQGALKAINHPDAGNDPGDDGINGFASDAFGMTTEYYEGDYSSREGNMTSIDLDEFSVAQKFNGGIRATNYGNKGLGLEHPTEDHLVLDKYQELTTTARQSITLKPGFDTHSNRYDANIDPLATYTIPDEPSKMYVYQYDDRQQMTTAIYDETAGFNYSSNQNRVDNLTYDDNGNILSLDRRDDNSQLQNDLNYTYDAGTNQLTNIPGYASYVYDEIGRLTAVDYVNGDDLYLTYDAYSNVAEIHSDPSRTTLKLSFKYNDQGYRLMKKNHDLDLETWYVRDGAGNVMSIYYEYQGQTFQGELPIYGGSRIGTAFRNTTHYKYNYELIDHQGNVRAILSKLKFMETLTMEPELALIEEQEFDNVADTRRQDAMFNHTPDALVNGASHAVWLNGALGRHVGPAKALKVTAGDVVSMEVYANYVDPDALQNLVTGLGTLIGSAYGFAPDDETLTYLSAIESAILGPAEVTATPGAGVPKAYMQYLLFDDNFNYVSTIPVGDTYRMMSSSAMATTDGSGTVISVAHEHLENEITVPQDGYLFIYLVNESLADVNVYFDDLTVMQTGVDIVKTAEYYPFGLVLDSWQKEDYRYGYQGQFAEKDEETGWSSFELRMYDPIIARWTSTDPYGQFYSPYLAMGNAPGMVDPDGGICPGCPAITGLIAEHGLKLLNTGFLPTMTLQNILFSSGRNIIARSVLTSAAAVAGSWYLSRADGRPIFLEGEYGRVRGYKQLPNEYTLQNNQGGVDLLMQNYSDPLTVMHDVQILGGNNERIFANAYAASQALWGGVGSFMTTLITSAVPVGTVFNVLKLAPVGKYATNIAVKYSDDLVKVAQKAYPKLAGKTQLHHITPKYLGGARNGPLAPLDGAYHQQITNAFRAEWGYGIGKPSAGQLKSIMQRVYAKYPLPPGYTF